MITRDRSPGANVLCGQADDPFLKAHRVSSPGSFGITSWSSLQQIASQLEPSSIRAKKFQLCCDSGLLIWIASRYMRLQQES